MKLVFIRTKVDSTVFIRDEEDGHALDSQQLEAMKISPKAGSSSKNIIFGLQQYGLVEQAEEWKLWNGPFQEVNVQGQMPVKLFPCNEHLRSPGMESHIARSGPPDIIWVEGPEFPPYLAQLFAACPQAFKMVYSKNWRPWKIAELGRYNLCLVDEQWEALKVRKHYPGVACGIWDKLIDYETMHYPIAGEKKYDICYVAYLRPRKNHQLLFHAMAKLKNRKLSCICIGDDRKGNREELEKLVADLNLTVHFTGEVAKEEVNQYVNQSKIGVMCSELDAAPRAILEYMAADIPVLVNAKLWAGTRYVGPAAGLIKPPAQFHLGITELLDNLHSYSPRRHLLQNYSLENAMARFIGILEHSGEQLNRRSNALGQSDQ